MRYEFIKIENTRDGVMAYMLDHERGVVVIAPVEYMNEAPAERPVARVPRRVEYVEEPVEMVARPVRRTREVIVEEDVEEIVDHTPTIRTGKVAGEGVDAGGLRDIGHSKPSKVQSIIPPHLRGVMRKDADFEKRETMT